MGKLTGEVPFAKARKLVRRSGAKLPASANNPAFAAMAHETGIGPHD